MTQKSPRPSQAKSKPLTKSQEIQKLLAAIKADALLEFRARVVTLGDRVDLLLPSQERFIVRAADALLTRLGWYVADDSHVRTERQIYGNDAENPSKPWLVWSLIDPVSHREGAVEIEFKFGAFDQLVAALPGAWFGERTQRDSSLKGRVYLNVEGRRASDLQAGLTVVAAQGFTVVGHGFNEIDGRRWNVKTAKVEFWDVKLKEAPTETPPAVRVAAKLAQRATALVEKLDKRPVVAPRKPATKQRKAKTEADTIAEVLTDAGYDVAFTVGPRPIPCKRKTKLIGAAIPGKRGGIVSSCATPDPAKPKQGRVWIGPQASGHPLKRSIASRRLRDAARNLGEMRKFGVEYVAAEVEAARSPFHVPAPIGVEFPHRAGASKCDPEHKVWQGYNDALADARERASIEVGEEADEDTFNKHVLQIMRAHPSWPTWTGTEDECVLGFERRQKAKKRKVAPSYVEEEIADLKAQGFTESDDEIAELRSAGTRAKRAAAVGRHGTAKRLRQIAAGRGPKVKGFRQ